MMPDGRISTLIQAFSLQVFFVPAQLASGGVSGISQLINHYTGWPIGHVYVPSRDARGELSPTDIWHLDDPVADPALARPAAPNTKTNRCRRFIFDPPISHL